MPGWNDPDTLRAWVAFNRRHARYRQANARLAQAAALRPGLRVLDLGAGTGGTARALLRALGPQGEVDCVEPAAAMRAAGQHAFRHDPRVRWHASVDTLTGRYDRVVCGAAVWQLARPRAQLARLAQWLAPGGALCFNIPGAYLGEADAPGGGADPWLTQGLLALAPMQAQAPARARATRPVQSAADWLAWLAQAGLWAQVQRHRQRLSQAAFRDWLKLPPLTPRLARAQRDTLVEQAFAQADLASWRWEGWCTFTAFRPLAPVQPLPCSPADTAPALLARRLRRRGFLALRQAVPQGLAAALQADLQRAARHQGLVDRRGDWCGGDLPALHAHGPWLALQAEVAASPALARLQRGLAGWPLWKALLGGPARADRGTVLRLGPPAWRVPPTPAHCDAEYLGDAPPFWTVWVALADTPLPLGPLALADPAAPAPASEVWRATALQAGDALVFAARTRHAALPNLGSGPVRWSVDLRVSRA